jgi:hypothetical protein
MWPTSKISLGATTLAPASAFDGETKANPSRCSECRPHRALLQFSARHSGPHYRQDHKREHLGPSETFADNRRAIRIDGVKLKYSLGKINPNCGNLHGGRPLSMWRSLRRPRYGTSMPLSRGRPHHHGGSGLRSLWRFGSQGDDENQLQGILVPSRNHPAGDLALCPVTPILG